MLTQADKRDWAREMRAQDEGWKLGYAHGRQDRLREWVGVVIGYLVGHNSKSSPMGRMMLAGVLLVVIALAVHYWWVVAIVVLGPRVFRFAKAHRPRIQPPKRDGDGLEPQF